MADNRRSSARYIVSLPCSIAIDGKALSWTMINLSLGGALIDAGEKFGMGARAQVSFRISTLEDPIDIGATVRWSDAKALGLQFDGLRAREVWGLNEFFKSLSSPAAAAQ